jgi:hypothetical protein
MTAVDGDANLSVSGDVGDVFNKRNKETVSIFLRRFI